MKSLTLALLPLTLSVLPLAAAAQQSPQLKATLEKLDAASTHFTSAQADFHKTFYNALLKIDEDPQDGSIYFIRSKSSLEMGLKNTGPAARTVEYRSGTVRVYNPGLNCYDSVSKPGIETYLTLGFGGSGTELAKAWNITDDGSETIDKTKVEKLELTPKDPNVQASITRFTLWIDLTRGVSLKQVLLAPSNDLQTATYTNITLNKKIDTKPYAIKGKPCGK